MKFTDDFVWHSRPDTDETCIILDGRLVVNDQQGKLDRHMLRRSEQRIAKAIRAIRY